MNGIEVIDVRIIEESEEEKIVREIMEEELDSVNMEMLVKSKIPMQYISVSFTV